MKYLILSTYPYNGSMNVGDDLLEKSLSMLIKEADEEACIIIKYLTDEQFVTDVENVDVVTGTISINPGYRGNIYIKNAISILENAEKSKKAIYLILASKFYPVTSREMNRLQVDKKYKAVLSRISRNGNFVARDLFALKTAIDNNIACKTCIGDIALYDKEYIKKKMRLPSKISIIAISLPHNKIWIKHAINLAVKLKRRYKCNCVLTIHGRTDITDYQCEIERERLSVVNFVEEGNNCSNNLSFYETVDLHVGFRLHAHIYCLRIRKPSILVAEDSRSGGHLYTFKSAGIDGTPSIVKKILDFLPERYRIYVLKHLCLEKAFAMRRVCNLVDKEINSNFGKTQRALDIVDGLYIKKVIPYISSIVGK